MSHTHEYRLNRSPSPDAREQALLRCVDAGLAGVVFVLPFCMGGRQALGQFLLIALTSFVAVAWMARQALARQAAWRTTTAQWLLLAAVLLIALQLMPLPEASLARLSPETPRMLPLWMQSAGELQIGSWSQLSLMPEATREALVQLMAYAALFLVAVQRLATLSDVRRLLRWIAWSSAAMAAFGLVQYLASNGKFFWFYEHPFVSTSDSVHGAFSNRNHFAHFLALGLGPLLWWLQDSRRAKSSDTTLRSGLSWLLLGVVLFAALMSFSRGGAVALLAALLAYLAVAWRASLLSRQFIAAVATIALLVGAMLLVHGYQSVAGRLDDLASGSLEQLDQLEGRRKVWSAVLKAATDFPLFGTGAGTHIEVYHRYLDQPSDTEYTHAESGYLQVLEETGLIGLALLLTGMGLCAASCIGTLRDERLVAAWPLLAAIAASLTASAVHALYDFVWYVPSCTAIVALLAACAFQCGTSLREVKLTSRSDVPHYPRWGWMAACCVLLLAGFAASIKRWGAVLAEPHWDRYRIASRGVTDPQAAPDLMLKHFTAIVGHDPRDARAQLALAEACLRQFDLAQQASENPLSLAALRDAAATSGFPSRAVLHAWLQRALGTRRRWLEQALWHTREALALCPLQAQAYLYLAELSFLDHVDPRLPSALIDQALAVRPHDGGVLFKAGEEAALAGNADQAVEYWKRAFHAATSIQPQMIEYFFQRKMPLAFFVEHLEPDRTAMQLLEARYRAVAPAEEFRSLLERHARVVAEQARQSQGQQAAALWLEAHRLAVELNDHTQAWHCAQQALASDVADLHVRLTVGQYLLARKRYDEAEPHLKWCLARKPGDKQFQVILGEAARGRINQQTQAAAPGPLR
jgi:O-antigen ligase/tetratricopeptide (TPR) repeat protein